MNLEGPVSFVFKITCCKISGFIVQCTFQIFSSVNICQCCFGKSPVSRKFLYNKRNLISRATHVHTRETVYHYCNTQVLISKVPLLSKSFAYTSNGVFFTRFVFIIQSKVSCYQIHVAIMIEVSCYHTIPPACFLRQSSLISYVFKSTAIVFKYSD